MAVNETVVTLLSARTGAVSFADFTKNFMHERFASGVSAKIALYKYSSFPFRSF